jgi:hypothetical protein
VALASATGNFDGQAECKIPKRKDNKEKTAGGEL